MSSDPRSRLTLTSPFLALSMAAAAVVIWTRLPDNSSILCSGSTAYAASFDHHADSPGTFAQLAETDPIGLLDFAIQHYHANIRDYTGIFTKSEQLESGFTPEQRIEILFKEAPFSVLMNYVKNAGLAQKALYVQGQNNGEVVVRPAGPISLIAPSVTRPVHSPEARKISRKTIDQFGLGNSLVMLRDAAVQARDHGDLILLKYLGPREVDGRKTFAFELRIKETAAHGPDPICIYHLDQEWLLPTAVTCLSTDGRLLGKYLFSQLKINVGLTDRQFARQANGL